MPPKDKSEAEDTYELPQASVVRIVKSALADGTNMSAEVKKAFSKAAGIFVLYLTNSAQENAKSNGRSIMNADDVLNAMEELDFDAKNFLDPLRRFIEAFRDEAKKKKADKAAPKKDDDKKKAAAAAAAGASTAAVGGKKKKPDGAASDDDAADGSPKKKQKSDAPAPAAASAATAAAAPAPAAAAAADATPAAAAAAADS